MSIACRMTEGGDYTDTVQLFLSVDEAAKLVALLSRTGNLIGPLLALSALPGMEDAKRKHRVTLPDGTPLTHFIIK